LLFILRLQIAGAVTLLTSNSASFPGLAQGPQGQGFILPKSPPFEGREGWGSMWLGVIVSPGEQDVAINTPREEVSTLARGFAIGSGAELCTECRAP